MRWPWTAPTSAKDFSWTTLWLNIACFITIVRYAVGAGIVIGSLSWQPGELDAALPGAILAALGALYAYRRGQDNTIAASAAQAPASVARTTPDRGAAP
jgi:hypothetical protein